MKRPKRVAFLCTGDELIHGDIIDTNSQYFAQQLLEAGIAPGRKVVVSDNQAETEAAMHYLLQDHDALITIGGLGPTSDDRTRFALADFLKQKLVINEQAWKWIVELFSSKGLSIPENNRQQALIPEKAKLIHNAHGAAAAFYVHDRGKDIFTLPGPPNECRSIFDEVVVPQLLKADYGHPIFRRKWLLLGVSEGAIAEQLDPLVTNTLCEVGYRVRYPYLEVKLWSEHQDALESTAQVFENSIGEKSVSNECKEASQQLLERLENSNLTFSIDDKVTRGRLASQLVTPRTHHKIYFEKRSTEAHVTLNGLEAYWNNNTNEWQRLPFQIRIEKQGKTLQLDKEIFQRKQKTLKYVVELVCWELVKHL